MTMFLPIRNVAGVLPSPACSSSLRPHRVTYDACSLSTISWTSTPGLLRAPWAGCASMLIGVGAARLQVDPGLPGGRRHRTAERDRLLPAGEPFRGRARVTPWGRGDKEGRPIS